MKRLVIWALALMMGLSVGAQEKIVLRLMGDSTMADKDLSYENPERGWGQRLKSHVDTNVVIANYAQNGRSTKSVQTLGIWDRVKNDLKAGEYLFIQFGHNDEKPQDPARYADPEVAFPENLGKFVAVAREKGATPVIITPVTRFNRHAPSMIYKHDLWAEAARRTGEKLGVAVIDLTTLSEQLLMLCFGAIAADVKEAGLLYLRITAFSFPFLALYNAGAAIYRSMGNSKVSMQASMLMNVINVVGNAFCIFVLKWGVYGVAIPTLVSRAAAGIYMLLLVLKPDQQLRLTKDGIRTVDKAMMGSILRIGVPSACENCFFSLDD